MPEVLTRVDEGVRAFTADELRQIERGRLEDAVLDAAKAELQAFDAPGCFGWSQTYMRAKLNLRNATRALVAFEAEHGIGVANEQR